MNPTAVKAAMQKLAADAQDVVASKSLSTAEKKSALERIETEIKGHSDELALDRQARAFITGASSAYSTEGGLSFPSAASSPARDYGWDGKSFGGGVIALDEAEGKALTHAVRTKSGARVEVTTKAALDVTTDVPAHLSNVPITFLREPTRVSSLIPNIPFPAAVLEYLRVNSVSGSAGTVAPGGAKPELTPAVAPVSATARKIACHAGINDESLQDFPNSNALITDVVSRAVIDEENAQLLNGDGTGQNLEGLLNVTGTLTRTQASGEDPFDTLRKADNDLRVGGSYTPATSYIMSPTTWMDISLIRDSYGRFMLGEPGEDIAPRLWGRPVVLTSQIADGDVVASNLTIACAVGWKMGLTIEAQSTGTDWTNNVSRFRCEERVGLAVFRPTAINLVTLGTPTGKAA